MAQYRTCNLSATSRPSSPLRHVLTVPPDRLQCFEHLLHLWVVVRVNYASKGGSDGTTACRNRIIRVVVLLDVVGCVALRVVLAQHGKMENMWYAAAGWHYTA
jgi:hypothetical protein